MIWNEQLSGSSRKESCKDANMSVDGTMELPTLKQYIWFKEASLVGLGLGLVVDDEHQPVKQHV